jgi:hypothetical protein
LSFFEKLFDLLDPLSGIVKICGLGGLSLGIVFLIFKGIITSKIFPILTKKHAYVVVRLIIIFSFSLAVLGLITFSFLKYNEGNVQAQKTTIDTTRYQPLILEKKGIIIPDSSKKK